MITRLILVALAVAPPLLCAQQPAHITGTEPAIDSTIPARELAPVEVTAARMPVVVGGASAVVIHPDSLHLVPAASLEQGLREFPFVLVRQNSRGETELSLRGSESRQMAVLLDGMPLTLGWDHRSDPSLVALTGAQRLVLVRGLSSLLHGPNVLGGIVEVDFARGAPGVPPRGELSAGIGAGEAGARVASVTAGAPVDVGRGTLTLRGGFGYRARDGLPQRDGAVRTNSDLAQAHGFATARWQQASGRYVGLTATGYRAERGVPPELHVATPRRWRYPAASRVLGVLSAGTGPAATPLGFGSVELAAGVNLGSTEIEQFADSAYRTVSGRERGDERTLSARLHGRHSLPGFGELRAAVTGAEVRYDEWNDGATTATRYRQRLWSAGLEAEWPIRGDVLLGGGVVYDWASTPETGGRPALAPLAAWGWRLGVTAPTFGDAVQLHAGVSRRARFPALRELYSDAVNRFAPNPDLRPERLLGAEVGATLLRGTTDGAGLHAQAVLFHHRLTDAIVRAPTGDGRFRRVNRDVVRSTGIELLAGWSTRASLAVTADVLVQRIRVAGADGDGYAEHQPELRGRLGLEAPLGRGVRLLADARYVGQQYCVHPDLATTVALAGSAEGDLGVTKEWPLHGGDGARLLESLRAMIGVDNIADAAVYDQCGLPRPGRALRVALQLR